MTSAATELKERAPTVWKLHSACSCPQWQSKVVSDQLSARLVTAAACLLKAKNQQMSALQYIVSIVLHNSGAKKKAFTRLNRLGVAMSHKRTLVKLQQMAAKFDTSLVDWKQSIEKAATLVQSSEYIDSYSFLLYQPFLNRQSNKLSSHCVLVRLYIRVCLHVNTSVY